jgi:autotransporter-associated beta strand protein
VTVNSGVTVNGVIFTVGGYTITGPSTVTLASPVIDVTGTNQAFISVPLGGTSGLVKNGTGTLALLSSLPHTFTGNTVINDGILFVNQTGSNAVNGDVIVGDNLGAASSAQLVYGASHQIPDNARVKVNGDGFWNLDTGDRIETIGTLELNGGLVSTSLGNGRLVLSAVESTFSTQAGMITGQLDLNGGDRTFTISDGTQANDVEVSAIISNGGIVKTGAGTLKLSGTNTFTSAVAINGGAIVADDLTNSGVAGPLGAGTGISIDGGKLIAGSMLADSTNRAIVLGVGGGTIQVEAFGPALTLI